LRAALRATFDVAPAEVSQLRILSSNVGILGNPRSASREEDERQLSLKLTRTIEEAWRQVIEACREERGIEGGDPWLMAIAVLGLINSVWRWYRPRGRRSLAEIADLYVDAAMRIVLEQD
jgi:AcrR family transcriptional regulator